MPNSGNVGIGTSSPDAKLAVIGDLTVSNGLTVSNNFFPSEFSSKNSLTKKIDRLLMNTSIIFTKNCGQLGNDEIRFYNQGGAVWFTDDGVWFEVRDELSMTSRQSTVHSPDLGLTTNDWRLTTRDYKRVILKQEFVGANHVRPVGRDSCSWNSSFFYGNDSTKWCTNVPNYQEIYYANMHEAPTINIIQKIIPSFIKPKNKKDLEQKLKYSRLFGCGTFTLTITIIIIYYYFFDK